MFLLIIVYGNKTTIKSGTQQYSVMKRKLLNILIILATLGLYTIVLLLYERVNVGMMICLI